MELELKSFYPGKKERDNVFFSLPEKKHLKHL